MNIFLLGLAFIFGIFWSKFNLPILKLLKTSNIYNGFRKLLCYFLILTVPFLGGLFVKYLIAPPLIKPDDLKKFEAGDWLQGVGYDSDHHDSGQ